MPFGASWTPEWTPLMLHLEFNKLPIGTATNPAIARNSKSPLCDFCPLRNSLKQFEGGGDNGQQW
jgi:hypothetical protein